MFWKRDRAPREPRQKQQERRRSDDDSAAAAAAAQPNRKLVEDDDSPPRFVDKQGVDHGPFPPMKDEKTDAILYSQYRRSRLDRIRSNVGLGTPELML